MARLPAQAGTATMRTMTTLTAVPDAAKAARKGSGYDAVLLVAHDPKSASIAAIGDAMCAAAGADQAYHSRTALWPAPGAAGQRLVIAPTGPLTRDYDDVRRYGEAAARGIVLARDAGARKVLLVVQDPPEDARYANAVAVAAMGARGALWQPLEAREARGKSIEPMKGIGVARYPGRVDKQDIALASAVDDGLRLAKDLAGTEPERMAPPKFAAYVQKAFAGTGVKVQVLRTPTQLQKGYPLLSAVARASMAVKRHHPCVVRLEYTGKGAARDTFLFAGKGLTYDTGGADIKAGGHMAGMSRDKGGAAAVAGLLLAAAKMQLKGVKLVAELGVVRNSIGADAYVADEIITSHAGRRVRVGNTDAEGRMLLADLLSNLRVRALREKRPHLLSVATLTGHAGRAVGPYSIALDNGPARAARVSERLAEVGDLWGDPFDISRLRREDFDFVRPRTLADDVLQCNNAPSSATPRGHQFPMAFLAVAAGLDDHGQDSKRPLPFTHVDIGGSGAEGGDWQHGAPTGKPLLAMLQALLRG